MIKNYGFIEPIVRPEDYFLGEGNLPRNILQPDGDWTDSLPVEEVQLRNGIDSINCTAFATSNQIEMYEFKAFGEVNNYSDRWIALISGTTKDGNDPSNVYEAIRKYGLVPEELCPWSSDIQSIDDYLSWKGVDKEACYRAGREWLTKKEMLHQWVVDKYAPLEEKINNMKIALKYSPLALDVSAWQTNDKGQYIRFGLSGHWTTCYAITDVFKIFDSYEPYKKDLVKDFNFSFVKRISIQKRLTEDQKKTILTVFETLQQQGLIAFFLRFWEIMFPQPVSVDVVPEPELPKIPPEPTLQDRLKKAVLETIGRDISTIADNNFACAEVVSRILQKIHPDFPILLSTIAFKEHFKVDKRFTPTLDISPWCIILCVTGTGNGKLKNAHIGVLGENDLIYSNSSLTGKFEPNYTLKTWINRYRILGGFKIYIYKLS